MSKHNQDLGQFGENIAVTHLEAKGYQLITRNWRCRWGEIDIIALNPDGDYAFIEVKTRRGSLPEEAITPHKSKRMTDCAMLYISELDLDDEVSISIDLIAIELDKNWLVNRIELLENITSLW